MELQEVFEALNEALRDKNTKISLQQYQINALEKRVAELEKKYETV